MSCSASHVESWMTHSFKQTSITGWTDWYTHKHSTTLFNPHSRQHNTSINGGIVLFFFLTWFSHTFQVAVLLHVGGSGAHLYLLCHLLCCPAGVGKWAAPFLQVSEGQSFIYCCLVSGRTTDLSFSSQCLPQIQVLGNTCGVQHFMQALAILMSPSR